MSFVVGALAEMGIDPAGRAHARVEATGRGRQSHNRGPRLKPSAATLSRIPSASCYTRSAL